MNNCIELHRIICFRCLHREITRNILSREKFFNSKIRSQVSTADATHLFHYLPAYFSLNKIGNEVFSKWTEIHDKIALKVLLLTYITNLKCKTEWNWLQENFRWYSSKLKQIIRKKYVFAQTLFFLQFNVRTCNPRICWKMIFSYRFINKQSKFHWMGDISATVQLTIVSSNFIN